MWIVVVIIAHILNAINFIVDKLLLSKFVRSPVVYAFMIGSLGMAVVVAFPWAWYLPSGAQLAVDAMAGASLILALLFFFKALQIGEASRVPPLVGGLIPIFTFVLSYFFLGERLSSRELIAFLLLLVGSVLITIMKSKSEKKQALIKKGYFYAVAAGLLFAISFVLTKYAYLEQEFLSAFIWIRFGSFAVVLFFLLSSDRRQQIKTAFQGASRKVRAVFIGNQILGAAAFLLLNYAISLASVSLINALQGVQYVFLILAMAVLVKVFPRFFTEKITREIVIQKVIAIILIGAGLSLIALNL